LRARLGRLGAGERVPVGEALDILRDVARALAYAHSAGVVHRDIKPDNVLLSYDAAVVADFGTAKAVEAARTESAATGSTAFMRAGIALGTPAYMAPEQAAGENNADELAGRSTSGAGPHWHAAVWPTPPLSPTPLGVLAGANGEAYVMGMAPGVTGNQRLIAGMATDAAGFATPGMWRGTAITRLPGPSQNPYSGEARDVANNGMAVGWVAEFNGGPARPVIWLNGAIHTDLSPACFALTGNVGGQAHGIAVTSSGQILIVGLCYTTQAGPSQLAEAVVFHSTSNAPFQSGRGSPAAG